MHTDGVNKTFSFEYIGIDFHINFKATRQVHTCSPIAFQGIFLISNIKLKCQIIIAGSFSRKDRIIFYQNCGLYNYKYNHAAKVKDLDLATNDFRRSRLNIFHLLSI